MKDSSAKTRFRKLDRYFQRLLEQDEIAASPTALMKQPTFDVEPPDVLSIDQVTKLLRVCRGTDFEARRDTAVIRLMYETGLRRGAVTTVTINDVDLDNRIGRVIGTGRQAWYQPIGRDVARDLDCYLRIRSRHLDVSRPELWLGRSGPMTGSGVYQLVRRRGRQAGFGEVHPHHDDTLLLTQ